jgi:hypothetical protein
MRSGLRTTGLRGDFFLVFLVDDIRAELHFISLPLYSDERNVLASSRHLKQPLHGATLPNVLQYVVQHMKQPSHVETLQHTSTL